VSRNRAFWVCSILGLLLLAACAAPTPSRTSSQPPAQPSRTEKAKVVDDEFLTLKEEGNFQDAVRLAQERVTESEKEFGPDHFQTAIWLNQLGQLHSHLGDYDQAEQAYLRSLDIKQKAKRPSNLAIAVSLLNLGDLYVIKGDYARAEPLLQRARELREKALGVNHPDVAPCLASLGRLKMFTGDYGAAEALNQRALAMSEHALGPDHLRVAACLDNLSEIRKYLGDLPEAEALARRALAIREKAPRPDTPLLARNLSNLALISVMMGKYVQAESFYKRALDVYARSVGVQHPAAAQAMSNLAGLYTTMGNYQRSEQLQRQALDILEKSYGTYHPRVAWAVEKMGGLCAASGDYRQALQRYRQALDITEKTVGPEHPEAANCLDGMGLAYYSLGNFAEAADCYRRALAIREKAFGANHVKVAHSLFYLAKLSQATGDYGKAEVLYTRALGIYEKALGPNHPKVAVCFDSLAALRGALNDYPGAFVFGLKAQAVNQVVLDQVMDIPSEELKIKYLTTKEQSLHTFLSLVSQHMRAQAPAVKSAFETWIQRKGLVLESQKRLYESLIYYEDPEALRIFQELERVRARLSTLAFSQPEKENLDAYRKRMEDLEREKEKLVEQLTRLSRAFALQKKFVSAEAEAIARALPDQAALIEFARINTFNFGAKSRRGRWLPPHYLAFVLHAGKGGEVRLVDLGDAAEIDAAVARLKTEVTAERRPLPAGAKDASQRLYDLVFRPVTPELGSVRQIFISPDGNLNLIPFEVLRGPGERFLIEDFNFNYLAAGRDVMAFNEIKSGVGLALLMGDPDFDLEEGKRESALKKLALKGPSREGQARRSVEMQGLQFSRLPGTREEVLAIRGLFGKNETESYLGEDALEEVLRARGTPRILHMATHGFFLEDAKRPEVSETEDFIDDGGRVGAEAPGPAPVAVAGAGAATGAKNPMLRSGIALAGANRSMAESGEAPGSEGIVTAEKILGLKLWGTEMVVLSACETGLGDVRTGEGVYGLRRAFTQAGAKSVVMSMWSVPDAETKELMIEFYRGAQSGKMNRCQALRQAALKQMAVVKQRYGYPHPFYWGAFVFMGEP
jgi:CHAT domain-containing protein/Flp pilus assembly protein TadD